MVPDRYEDRGVEVNERLVVDDPVFLNGWKGYIYTSLYRRLCFERSVPFRVRSYAQVSGGTMTDTAGTEASWAYPGGTDE
jgi:hypothetical protein